MYVQSISQDNISMRGKGSDSFWKRAKQKLVDAIPEATIKDGEEKVKDWVKNNDLISNPAINRSIMGVTAMMFQPAIDLSNKRVDEDTREISKNKTIAKILAGTTVGIVVRELCYKLCQKMTDVSGNKSYSKALLPKKYLKELSENHVYLNNYRSAISTCVAMIVMLFTNFLIDAPLTTLLTNKLNEKTRANKIKQKEVNNG